MTRAVTIRAQNTKQLKKKLAHLCLDGYRRVVGDYTGMVLFTYERKAKRKQDRRHEKKMHWQYQGRRVKWTRIGEYRQQETADSVDNI